ncbi:serine/threonine-protein kinase [Blastococcus sp. TF02A-26]|uniref:serine/threonine-protein kinase n=1 Tax=Blastococcus sp. TF02A-26 TaxID=2250577 RepID=UPI000DEBB975|nr:serine/threonine-protein kinase [Blastococcus sp. TF02A-26]RBY88704.1 serine/threonine protein kinase [Blastococcus sp. TF02A-26]
MVEPGRQNLGERYELAQLIASGGMGQVWRGTDVLLGRPVAVKVLRSEYTGDPTFLARFRAEAQHAAALSHPNIASVFDYGETRSEYGETLAYLVMELVEGEPLSAVLRREGPLDTATTLSVLQQTAAALSEAHRVGLVHRDVKPGNILVCPDGSVKITDFGIAWSAGSVPLTRTGQVIGTPQYLSPEQAEGRLATPASDVYALGLVGYECLAGHPAFDGDNAVTIALKQLREDPEPLSADLPTGVRTIITRALAKDPAARMPDGGAFAEAVAAVRAGRAPADEPRDTGLRAVPLAPPPGRSDTGPDTALVGARRTPPPPVRRRASAVLVPLVALLLGAAAAAGVFLALSSTPPSTPVAAAQTQEADTVVLTAGDYVDRSIEDVASELSALGLSVFRRGEVAVGVEPGTVTRISPTGRALRPGDDVTVWYAVAPQADRVPSGGGGGGGGGVAVVDGDEPVVSDAAPSPSTTPALPTDTAPPPASGTPDPTGTSTPSSSPATDTGSPTSTTSTPTPSAPTTSTPTGTPAA